MRFSWKIYLRNNILNLLLGAIIIRIIPYKRVRMIIYSLFPILKRIKENVIAFSIAGGDSFSDIYGNMRFLYIILPQIIILLLKVRLIQLPQTYGPFKSKISRLIAKMVLSKSEMVYTRESNSLEYIQNNLLKNSHKTLEKVKFGYDVGFLLKPISIEINNPKNISGRLIGLNISGLLNIGGYNRSNQFNLTINYRELILEIINMLNRKNYQIILIPHVFGESIESDVLANRKIMTQIGNTVSLRILDQDLNAGQVKYTIGKCDFFIGSRMHACIGAVSQKVPTACLAYSKKFLGVFGSIGLENIVLDLRSGTNEEILSKLEGLLNSKENIKKLLDQKMENIFSEIQQVFVI